MDAATRQHVRDRADEVCEYCHLAESFSEIQFHVEHVIAQQHLGGDGLDNLALACDRCNLYKGPNIAALDPESGALVSLFHPRRDVWEEHFRFDSSTIGGLTPTGRATVRLLQMNAAPRVRLRERLRRAWTD